MAVNEIWKPVRDFEGLYEVSNLGRVRSLPRHTTSGRILKTYVNKRNGYVYVGLCKNNKKMSKRVHKLVMMAFDPREEATNKYNKNLTIDHKDGNKTNNRLDNLEWCTQSENQLRAYSLGINAKSTKKVINLDTLEIFESMLEAAKSVGGKRTVSITRVCKGQRSHYRNNHFAYLSDYENNTIPAFQGKYKKRSSEILWQ